MKKIILICYFLISAFSLYAQTYYPQVAVEYADTWWNGKNTGGADHWGFPYNYYGTVVHPDGSTTWFGGDCANFVSQCLRAGGLILDEGADGFGKGVDNRKCIKAVDSLIAHLQYKKYSFTDSYYPIDTLNLLHTLGDPLFVRNASNSIKHSLICSYIDGKKQLYACHSSIAHRAPRSNYKGMSYSRYFNLSIPAQCFNCIKDPDEEDIDCGGPCPPCEHAPDQIDYVTPTNNLPSEVRATKKITAGNAAVKVLSGQNVTFITAGEIHLLPGFEAAAGSNFNTQIKSSSTGVTAICGGHCGSGDYHSTYYKYQDSFHAHNIVNVDKVEFEVYAVVTGQLLHSGVVSVTKEGTVDLWNLNGSGNSSVFCIAYVTVYTCMGVRYGREVFFWIVNGSKSLNEETDETENSDISFSPPVNNILLQDENAPPNFVIIPNPNPGAFQIETNFPLSDIVNLKITNLSGALIYETQNLSSNTIQLPASASGQHVVIVTLKAGAVLTQKMMLQR